MKNKVIVITGASSGIGEETAKLLAKDGNKVVLAARREAKLQQIVNDIKKTGGQAEFLVTDVTKNDEVVALAKFAVEKFGQIDVWMNNAGIMPDAPFSDNDIDLWDKTIDVNLKGTVYGIAAALPYMKKRQHGQFINISSVAGHWSHKNTGVYSATKWGVRALSESLREECAPDNIRVTVISPGAINTELITNDTVKETTKGYVDFYANFGISASNVALTIKQAIDLPEEATWNEVVIRPTKQVL